MNTWPALSTVTVFEFKQVSRLLYFRVRKRQAYTMNNTMVPFLVDRHRYFNLCLRIKGGNFTVYVYHTSTQVPHTIPATAHMHTICQFWRQLSKFCPPRAALALALQEIHINVPCKFSCETLESWCTHSGGVISTFDIHTYTYTYIHKL